MNKRKVIFIIGIVCLLIVIIISIILFNLKAQSQNSSNKDYIKNEISVEVVTDVKKTYNINKCINDMIEDVYDKGIKKNVESYLLPYDLMKELKLYDSLKRFYVKNAYEARCEDNISVFFVNGYIVNIYGEINMQDINLTFISDQDDNSTRLELYGTKHKDMFEYNENIEDTKVIRTEGLKITKKEKKEDMQLEDYIYDNEIFKNSNLNQNISEDDLVYWYLQDYKIKEANKTHQKIDNSFSYLYEGNYDEGYTITYNNEKKYFIEPENLPMNYKISII